MGTRIFNGKTYKLASGHGRKEDAENQAKKLKKQGYLVKVTGKKWIGWFVWKA